MTNASKIIEHHKPNKSMICKKPEAIIVIKQGRGPHEDEHHQGRKVLGLNNNIDMIAQKYEGGDKDQGRHQFKDARISVRSSRTQEGLQGLQRRDRPENPIQQGHFRSQQGQAPELQ